jgi:hypothetical protein
MTRFTVYFDASGHPDGTKVLSVAGFIATVEHWIRIERKWKKVLGDYGVASLHMKDFAHSTGEFVGWKENKTKRRLFLSALIDILRPLVHASFACSVDLVEYRRVDELMRVRKLISPLALTGIKCIGTARERAEEMGIKNEDIRFVFEDGDQDRGNLASCIEHDFGFAPTFEKKSSSVAFQAADLLAYEHLQITGRCFDEPTRYFGTEELRGSLKALRSIPHFIKQRDTWILLEAPNIEAGFRKALIPKPLK